MKNPFSQNELPFKALETLGLFVKGEMLLEDVDFKALLSGRRTSLVSLSGLSTALIQIEKLDARLSLMRSPKGEVELRLHPIYKNAQGHALLSGHEAALLSSGKKDFVQKTFQDSTGGTSLMNFEYDALTRDFITYFPDEVQAPDRVNGFPLSAEQRMQFKRGEVLELDDGTRFQHRASESKGMLSNRAALVLAVTAAGGSSYLLVRGIGSLKGEEGLQVDYHTPAYKEAFAAMQAHLQQDAPQSSSNHLGIEDSSQQRRGIGPFHSR